MFWTRRRHLLTLALCFLLVVFAVVIKLPQRLAPPPHTTVSHVSTPSPTPTATWHPTFSIVIEGPFTTIARRGSQLTYRWSPQADPAPTWPTRSTITCTYMLYGPFPTLAAAADAGRTDLSTSAPAVAAAPLTLDNWTREPYPGMFTLPENLALGYYVSVGRTVNNGTLNTLPNNAVLSVVG